MQDTTQRTGAWVNATVQENIWAGFGSGVLAYVVGYALDGHSDALSLLAVLVAAGFFGTLCVIRFTADERKLVWDMHMARTAENHIIELEATVADLRSELKRTGVELRTNEFKRASQNAKALPAVDESAELRADVSNIISRRFNGAKFGRAEFEKMPRGRARWEAAMRLLFDCGAMEVTNDGKQQRLFVDGLTQAQAEAKAREAFKRIDAHKNTNFTPALS